MTNCKCKKPRFTLHYQDRPKDKNNPMIVRCNKCGGLPKSQLKQFTGDKNDKCRL